MSNRMRISGFSLARNATKLYYPVKESIQSILPLVDEFVIALGNCDEDDTTLQEIESIGSDKIKIIHTVWDLEKYPDGTEYAHQTDIAKNACTGDWLFYLQSDEVIHESALPVIRERCASLLDDNRVEGLLFDYLHFWGDYKHYFKSHAWYAKEIRIIRNKPDIHSWKDAQSFRRIPGFDGRDYNQKTGTHKLNVVKAGASVFHYGWVRPPQYMQKKYVSFVSDYKGKENAHLFLKYKQPEFNYGDLEKLHRFTRAHPAVMEEMISRFNWQDKLDSFNDREARTVHKHEKWKYRFLSWIEEHIMGGEQIFTFKNYNLLK
ncbi:MAG: glycosyltransferase family 2 protein [Chitinophagaceae bacterium]|nr:glycosyltransferase family 2 protein [Chitinophagaceae bacterium]